MTRIRIWSKQGARTPLIWDEVYPAAGTPREARAKAIELLHEIADADTAHVDMPQWWNQNQRSQWLNLGSV